MEYHKWVQGMRRLFLAGFVLQSRSVRQSVSYDLPSAMQQACLWRSALMQARNLPYDPLPDA
jgi:hypothetical protein